MTALAVLLAAAAAWSWRAPVPEPRLRRLLGQSSAVRATGTRNRLPVLAGAVAGIGALLAFGGVLGVLALVACVLLLPRLTRRMETRGVRRRREDLERQAPAIAELLAATLASGATVAASLAAVAPAVGPPGSDALRPVLASLALGADPGQAWLSLSADPSLRPIGAALARSSSSGAPLADLLARLAEDLRRDRQRAVEVAARSAGVRAVAPLGACFLPAFVLVGVVPVVVSLASGLLG